MTWGQALLVAIVGGSTVAIVSPFSRVLGILLIEQVALLSMWLTGDRRQDRRERGKWARKWVRQFFF